MKLLLLFLFPILTLAQINEAELLLSSEKYAEAAALYDLAEDKLMAQDHYNAALCHALSDNTAGIKKHLTKLAILGIKKEEVLVFEQYFNSYDWQSFLLVYEQLWSAAEKENRYTRFLEDLLEQEKNINELHQKFSESLAIEDTTIVPGQKVKIFVSWRNIEPEKLRKDQKEIYSKLLNGKEKLIKDYLHFFKENPFPKEIEQNGFQLHPFKSEFISFSLRLFDLIRPTVDEYYNSSGKLIRNFNYPIDSVFTQTYEQTLNQVFIKAVKEERIKPLTALYLISPNSYYRYSPFKAIQLFITEGTCEDVKHSFYYLHQDIGPFKMPFELESRADFGLKYRYAHESPHPFLLHVNVNPEQAYFDSCEAAAKYLRDKNALLP